MPIDTRNINGATSAFYYLPLEDWPPVPSVNGRKTAQALLYDFLSFFLWGRGISLIELVHLCRNVTSQTKRNWFKYKI